MAPPVIKKSTFQFLKKIAKNNNREWFHKNKDLYKDANDDMKVFLASLETEMNKIDMIDKTKLFRIYRDVRFSKDKTPYNSHFSMSFSRATSERRGGYYLKVTPGGTRIACGFWNPEPKDLKLIRNHIAADDKSLRKILNAKKFKDCFGPLEGAQVKTSPKGFDKDHPAIDLLRYKQLIVTRAVPDKDICTEKFMKEIITTYKTVRPFFDYMSEILTHDLNGVSIIK